MPVAKTRGVRESGNQKITVLMISDTMVADSITHGMDGVINSEKA